MTINMASMWHSCCGVLLAVLVIAESTIIPLNGQWNLKNENKGTTLTGKVPGSMYTALLDNKMIQDPYYRKNDEIYRWIARDDWTYNRTVQVTSEILQMSRVVLVCEGLDTVSTVYVNDKVVGTSDNMFVRYVFDVKSALKVGENTIKVMFKSAVRYAAEKFENHAYVVPPECVVVDFHGECHVNMIRKEQCSFSWDWGPSFPTQGIWRDIYIQGYNQVVIRDVTAATVRNADGSWSLDVEVFHEVSGSAAVSGQLQLRLDTTNISYHTDVTLSSTNTSVSLTIPIPKSTSIKMWWPNGYGNHTLYPLYVIYTSSDGQMSDKTINVGFRTVELVQDFVSSNTSEGRTFYFKINGKPLFFKGSNWIPADSFLERVTPDRIQNLLQSTVDANMNVLRVWGGGVYESSYFYDTADRLGIMLWQDFMFGCSMYPVNQEFLDSVAKEVRHQVRRLKHHPSIVIWSGNNENEKALIQSWYNTDVNFTRYYNDYLTLNKDVIAKIVKQEDTSRPFIMSSPSNGIESEEEGGVSKTPWSDRYGDIHDYRYLDPFYKDGVYRVARFASEYGLQSYPSHETLNPVYEAGDMDIWSDLNQYRQHHPFGNIELMAEAIMYVNLPNSNNKIQKFKDTIYITQINQAIAMKTETEHYRRWQNRLDDTGRGNTMGAMYWQLNDIWQAPTWASTEYGGKWKMLHYYAKNFFAPLLISPFEEADGSTINVFIVMDQIPVIEHRHPLTHHLQFKPDFSTGFGIFSPWNPHSSDARQNNKPFPSAVGPSGTLYIQMYSWDNLTPLHTWTQTYMLNTTSESVFTRNVNDMMKEAGCIRDARCFLFYHLGDPLNGPTAWQPLTTFNTAIGLQNASVQISHVEAVAGKPEFIISVSSNAVAPFVWLEAEGIRGRFSDNGFLMVTNKKLVTFYPWEITDMTTLTNALTVKSLMNIYH